ncbi:hypothetical protein A2U01_0073757, partial [Trifolium medium]|nr:hypothetical protein [Trifolium medium]
MEPTNRGMTRVIPILLSHAEDKNMDTMEESFKLT